jgi:hypothetical protein
MKGIVYIHVPKCGGSSFGAALRLRYAHSQATIPLNLFTAGPVPVDKETAIAADHDLREAELVRLLSKGTRCVAGHVRYNPVIHDGPGREHAYVTLLRDPVERFVSHYLYLERRHPDPERPPRIEDFIITTDAARLASQYLFYFAGVSQNQTDDLPEAVARAQTALSRFALIGDLAKPQPFVRGLARLAQVPALPWLPRNRAPVRTTVPPDLRDEIEALCAPDIAIYRAARDLAQAA